MIVSLLLFFLLQDFTAVIFPVDHVKHKGFAYSKWEDLWWRLVQLMNLVRQIGKDVDAADCPIIDVCEFHPADEEEEKELRENYPWHANFQTSACYGYPPKAKVHVACALFNDTSQHNKNRKKYTRRLYVCESNSTMRRHLFRQTPHADEMAYCRALVLSDLFIYISLYSWYTNMTKHDETYLELMVIFI